MTDNYFGYSGFATKTRAANTADTFEKRFEKATFPWESYSFTMAQTNGVFHFEFNNLEMPIYKAHIFERNTFEHIYCQRGCAYYVTGDKIQQFVFRQNYYKVLVSRIGAAVFYGDVNLKASNSLAQVWIQTYQNEVFDRIWGGAIYLTGNNVPITFIFNS